MRLTFGRYHDPAPSAGLVPTSDATLINGKGRSVGNAVVPLAVVGVTQGLRYRLRLVSISCDPYFDFSIDGHSLVSAYISVSVFISNNLLPDDHRN